jgi:hypothetical protein
MIFLLSNWSDFDGLILKTAAGRDPLSEVIGTFILKGELRPLAPAPAESELLLERRFEQRFDPDFRITKLELGLEDGPAVEMLASDAVDDCARESVSTHGKTSFS